MRDSGSLPLRLLVPLLAVMLSLMACSEARDPWEAYYDGHYEQAASLWQTRAEAGDADAQTNLGMLYALGQGVQRDYGQAFDWYQKAALQGQAQAQKSLANLYENGRGVEMDRVMAYVWYQEAYENGNERALPFMDRLSMHVMADQIMVTTAQIRARIRDAHPSTSTSSQSVRVEP